MKTITRAKLKGEKLNEHCKKAYTITEYSKDGKSKTTYCYGYIQCINDEPLEKCKKCKAFVKNIED